jgi:hypothetical protein
MSQGPKASTASVIWLLKRKPPHFAVGHDVEPRRLLEGDGLINGAILLDLNFAAERQRLLTFAIVGGGPTGVEMAGAISEVARQSLAIPAASIQQRRASSCSKPDRVSCRRCRRTYRITSGARWPRRGARS